ncbi:MAG: ABC transporter permease [Spirochaetia bacterium]|nr:ABC transporter permease [Spirochaetia bacterium]
MSPLDRKALRELLGMKSQTITIALVTACGVAILISYITAYNSLNHAVDIFYRSSRFADVFSVVKRAPRTLLGQISDIEGVDVAEGRILFDATINLPDMIEPATGRFVSLPDDTESVLNRLYITRGRIPEPFSLTEAVVSEAFAKANNLNPGAEFSATINGRYQMFNVVGIGLSPEYVYFIRGILPDDKHYGVVWVSERTLSQALHYEGMFNSVSLRMKSDGSEQEIIHTLDRLLNGYGGLGAFGRDKHPSHFFLNSELEELKVMIIALPSIFLGVAAFLLHIVIARLVTRQREQIATLKALGYGNFQIAVHYFKIVSIMILLGAIGAIGPGIWLGQAMTNLYADYFRFPSLDYVFSAYVPLIGIAVSLGAALFGASLSLREAFRLVPAEAMRPPAPPIYKRAWIEKLAGGLSTRSKMAVRNFTMKPFRSGLSILGLAMALGIVLLGLFWTDTISFLLKFQFNNAQREDATVLFNDVVPDRALGELMATPGVTYAEGYRAIGVRLRKGELFKDTSIIGLPQTSRLRRLMNRDLTPIAIAQEGLMLNVRLAEKLDAHPGDFLEIETLTGNKKHLRVVITAITEELLGSGAYMDIRALNRILQEDNTITMAAITVDPRLTDTVFTRLKGMPMVASVDSKKAQIETFQKMLATMMLTMAFFMVGFASVIAVGVVYNMVMVSLSERSWELASLRVLGFTRGEVFRLLIGEIILEVSR